MHRTIRLSAHPQRSINITFSESESLMTPHTIDHIRTRLTFIQSYLEAQYDHDEGHAIAARLTEVSAYMAESGKLLADAKYHLQATMQSELVKLVKNMLPDYSSSTLQNAFVRSICKEENLLVNAADRINASCVHQIDAMRTQISYLKSLAFAT